MLAQDESGIIIDHHLQEGNPSDRTNLISEVMRCRKATGKKSREIATDKGFYSQDNLDNLRLLGVKRVAIPKIGRLNKREALRQKKPWFKELQRFRCGIEAAISMLKRKFSLGDVLVRGTKATAIWTSFAIFSYNLWQLT